jgi:hypothetical protein
LFTPCTTYFVTISFFNGPRIPSRSFFSAVPTLNLSSAAVGDSHTGVCGLHVLAFVLAGAAAGLADLIDQVEFELGQPFGIRGGVRKESIDSLVCGNAADKLVDNSGDRLLASEPVVERF